MGSSSRGLGGGGSRGARFWCTWAGCSRGSGRWGWGWSCCGCPVRVVAAELVGVPVECCPAAFLLCLGVHGGDPCGGGHVAGFGVEGAHGGAADERVTLG